MNYSSITPEEYFTNTYIEEVYESEQVLTSTELLQTILYAKYKNSDLNIAMKNKCHHLTE